jgi:enamine deaminase RidA (YjgF/YER057c/UK114 family)
MATKTPVLTDKAPKPLPGIYSQAIIANGVVYCSGAVAMDPTTGKLIDGDVKAHTVRQLQLTCPTRKLIEGPCAE